MTTPADGLPGTERELLLRAVRKRLDGPGGASGSHDDEARAETDALLWHLVGPDPYTGGHRVDEEVALALGLALLTRAVSRPEAPTAALDGRQGVLLLAPFHCRPPVDADPLPKELRAAIDALLAPADGADGAAVRAHATALAALGTQLFQLAVMQAWPRALEASAEVSRTALPHLPSGGFERALTGCNLGYALLWLHTMHGLGGPEEIAEAADALRDAFAAIPPDHPHHARCAYGLGLALLTRAGLTEDHSPLPEAIELLRTAARGVAPAADGSLAHAYADLGHALTLYAADQDDQAGPELREEALAVLRRSVDLTPPWDWAALRIRLKRLAEATLIGIRHADPGQVAAQAGEAAWALRRLLDLTPVRHPEHADLHLWLAMHLLAAQWPQNALDLLAAAGPLFAGDADRSLCAEWLTEEATRMMAEWSPLPGLTPEQQAAADAIVDLWASMSSAENRGHPLAAVAGIFGAGPGDGVGRPRVDFGKLLAGGAFGRSVRDAISATAYQMTLRRAGQQGQAPAEAAVPAPLDTGVLDRICAACDRLLTRVPPDTGEYRLFSAARSMAVVQKARLDWVGAPRDENRLRALYAVLPLELELFRAFPQQLEDLGIDPEHFAGHAALKIAYGSPFLQLQMLEEGIRGARDKLGELPPDSDEYDDALVALANLLFVRYLMWSEEKDYTDAEAIARELADRAEPDLRIAMLVLRWVPAAQSRALHPVLLGAEQHREGLSSSRFTRLTAEQAAGALDALDPASALEALEDGRTRLLSLALDTRRDLAALSDTDAALHARLRDQLAKVRDALRHLDIALWANREEIARQYATQQEAARIITELQRRPGFQRFLTPLTLHLDDLLPAAAEGPVVSVNVHPRRCDALALCPDGLRHVPLPRLHAADLAAQAEAFRLAVDVLTAGPRDPLYEEARTVFTGTLAWLWDVLAEPVLKELGFTDPLVKGAPRPRLWWSPSGVLNSFPLHAAGHHGPDAPAGASVLDRVVSSYTPTVRALLAGRAHRRAEPGRRGVLAVAMPKTPGQPPLKRTVAEATAAAAAGGGVPLIGADATREAVRTAVLDAAVVHFACHADSGPDAPAAGRLLLADGALSLGEISELHLESAELAYLSACGTARGGSAALAEEAVHLASAFQLAGYSQSVATLWEVEDAFAAEAAATFHRLLSPSLPEPGPLPAAHALHDTVHALRTADPQQPWTWGALVHAGT
ncbi:CHAT domain-containing protein [Streptomyces sp. NPDC001118]